MRWFGSSIKVIFIDDASGESLGVTEMPPSDLPESFELQTTLHLGDVDWSVIDASPNTRAEYAKSRTLTLRLSRIEMVDPTTILFTLPTICDSIPPLSDQALSGNEFALAADDWRQFELVSNALAGEVDEQIALIRLIHENAAVDVGWREIHVRTRPEVPLRCNLSLAELARALNLAGLPKGVTYRGESSPIVDAYSFAMSDGLNIYGLAPGGSVRVIAFENYFSLTPSSVSIGLVKQLARGLDLDLVYWARCARLAPDDPLVESLFSLRSPDFPPSRG